MSRRGDCPIVNSHRPRVRTGAPFSSSGFYSLSFPRTQAQWVTWWGVFLRCGLLNWPQPAVPHAGELKSDRNSSQAELPGHPTQASSTFCETLRLPESHFPGTTLSYRCSQASRRPVLAWYLKAKGQTSCAVHYGCHLPQVPI